MSKEKIEKLLALEARAQDLEVELHEAGFDLMQGVGGHAQALLTQATRSLQGVLRHCRALPGFPDVELSGRMAESADAAARFAERIVAVVEALDRKAFTVRSPF